MKEIAPNVIMIPPKEETAQEKERKRNLRVAAYCRVSTDDEEQLSSYENQRDYYTDKIINEPGWTMVDVFADEGKTGTSTCSRKDFLRMIRQCRQGKIDMILTKSVSRFARNTVDTLNFTRELRNLGIPVIFEEQNINSIYPESEFLITLYGAFAQSESENTSSRVTWGIRQAMRSGHAHLHYKWLLGYERGPDGKAVIVPEQAETVRFIYQRYLAGDTLRTIKAALEEKGCLTVTGKTEWTPARIQSILTNEKYCGDALLQKTFIQDCISKKVIQNTGQLPKYLIQNHHPAIISREEFDAVQLELARRRARTGGNKKSAPTGRCKYSGKYMLSNLLFCGECGTAYRRCVWQRKGYQRVVWRCISRITYGTKYCKHSVTIDEDLLKQAILTAVNRVMASQEDLTDKLISAMREELLTIPGEGLSLSDIDRALENLANQFDQLLKEASLSADSSENAEQFRRISTAMSELKERRAQIEKLHRENEQMYRRTKAAEAALPAASAEITEWKEDVLYQLLEKVTVLDEARIKVTFRSGVEIEQALEKDERSVTA